MPRIAVLLAALVAAAVFTTTAGSTSTATRLTGTVGPGFTITLKMGTKPVKTLKAGRYTFVVTDKSKIHNFHLKGRVKREITTLPFTGKKTVTLTLKPGRYTYVCDPHVPPMRGNFRVT